MLQVDGREPGEEIAVPATAPTAMRVKADVTFDRAGRHARDSRQRRDRPDRARDRSDCEWPSTARSTCRSAAGSRRARRGPKSKYLGDDYAFAQTSPVYVVRGGRRFVKAADVQFLADTVDAIWTRVERARWRSDAERDAFRAAVDRARAFYQSLKQ